MRNNKNRIKKSRMKRDDNDSRYRNDNRSINDIGKMSRREYNEMMARRQSQKNRKRKKVNQSVSGFRISIKRKLLKLCMIACFIVLIYNMFTCISWINMAVPMMKNQSSVVVDANGEVMDVIRWRAYKRKCFI